MGSSRELGVSATPVLPGPPELVFGVLSDTNRWNRLTGVSPTTYSHELTDVDDPASRTRIGRVSYYGIPARFAEEGEYWSGRMLWGERRFLPDGAGRLYARAVLDVNVAAVEGDDARTRARLRIAVAPRGLLGYVLAPLVLLQTWVVLRRYIKWVRGHLACAVGAEPNCVRSGIDESSARVARRARLVAAADRDHPAPVSRNALRARAAAFSVAPLDSELARRVLEFVTLQPEETLLQVRPFEVARAWGRDRRQVLRAFLHATQAGLLDLEWQVNCPTCRVGSDVSPSLATLGERVHCDECDISFDVDFADNVEATFTPNPAIRRVRRVVFCAASPLFRPHVHGTATIAAGDTRVLGELPAGDLLIRALGRRRQLTVAAAERPADTAMAVRVADGAVTLATAADEPVGRLVVHNDTARPVRLRIEHTGWDADIARGSTLLELPEFVELFGADAPAAGMRLAVGSKAIVFSDIVGSTELYQRIGDARAFAVIQEHWRDARAIAGDHSGAIVKTLGDGLMCLFPSLGDAVAASLAMVDAADALAARRDLAFAIRVGAHEGPCFAARANDRLDLFGTTVNIAARLAGTADGRQVAVLADAVAHPALQAVLTAQGAVRDLVRAQLRGIPGAHSIVLASRPGAGAVAAGEHARAGARNARAR